MAPYYSPAARNRQPIHSVCAERTATRKGSGVSARQLANALHDVAKISICLLRVRGMHGETRTQQVSRVEAEIERTERAHAADEQCRADHEHERQCDLPDDQHAVDTTAPGAIAFPVFRATARSDRVATSAGANPQASPVTRVVTRVTTTTRSSTKPNRIQIRQKRRAKEAGADACEHESQHASNGGQHQALRHEQARQSRATDSHRQSYRDLSPAPGGANEQQAGDVRARDHEHERRDAIQPEGHLDLLELRRVHGEQGTGARRR